MVYQSDNEDKKVAIDHIWDEVKEGCISHQPIHDNASPVICH